MLNFSKLRFYTQVRYKIKVPFGFEAVYIGLNFRHKLKSGDRITKAFESVGIPPP